MRYFTSFLVLLLFASCSHRLQTEKKFVEVLPENADSVTLHAARQLAVYWYKMTGRKLEKTSIKGATPIYVEVTKGFPLLTDSLKTLGKDGYVIAVNKRGIFLAGKTPLATLYAVNTLLEEYLGCMKFTAKEEYIPHYDTVKFVQSFKVYRPAFQFRRVHSPGGFDRSWCEWYKINSLDIWGMYVHTFNKLIPPKKYFNRHPEYYSLVDGRRLQDGQLCLSNPQVIRLLIKNLGDTIQKNPTKKYWSVSQNDTYNPCECPNCKKLYKKYGGYSGAYLYAVNKVAKAYPNKIISTLAYQFTRHAPKNIKPDSNVNIMLCSIESNRAKPLIEMNGPGSFVHDLIDWSKLTHNIYLWDYVVQFKNYLTPFPNFPVLQPNVQLFKKLGVNMLFEQASGHSWSDLIELKQYLLAKLMWNPEVNVDSLARRFITLYYGKAAPYIYKYYSTMNHEMILHRNTQRLDIYGFPSFYKKTFLRPVLMKQYMAWMDSAEQMVKNSPIFLRRVKHARLPVDFAYVDLSVNNSIPSMPSLIKRDGKTVVNPLIKKLLDSLVSVAALDSRIYVNERGLTLAEYRNYILGLLHRKTETNILKDAKVTLLTRCSPKYPVGKVKALYDNLFGSLDFHVNWLGFEGDDMIAVADFGKPVTISHVEMNFLKAVNSWIFLPLSVKVEGSQDGKHYHLIQKLKGDNSDHSYLVKSVPFVFHFSPVHYRYFRFTATSMKMCPKWHRGYGHPSWLFIDEIIVH